MAPELTHRSGSATPQAPIARRRAWVEVDLGALSHNYRLIRGLIGPQRRILAVVKADAYGHGAPEVALRLEAEGADLFGVAIPEEGLELRRRGVRASILVVGAAAEDQLPGMTAADLLPTAYSPRFLEAILSEGARRGSPVRFHLKVDTGMGRLGLLPDQIPEALERLSAFRARATLDGVFTTLAGADDPGDPRTRAQIATFLSAVDLVRAAGLTPRHVHAANSGGIINFPSAWLDTVRPGIMLYGIHPSDRSERLDLRPALSFKTRLVLVKRVPAGAPLGYGGDFVTSRASIIGTVAAGYADGLARLLSTKGEALVRGRRVPFAGRISMDHAMVDLTEVPQAAEGDEVVLIGGQDADAITAEAFARWAETIPYEILSRLGPRVPRIFVPG